MPFPIAAVISAVVSAYAANEASKSAAQQSAAEAAKREQAPPVNMTPVSLESLSVQQEPTEQPTSSALPTGADTASSGEQIAQYGAGPSAHARTLEGAINPTSDAPPSALDPNSAEGVPPALSPDYTGNPQVPQKDLSGGSGMTGLEMAQLGLTLGSMLGKRQPGPSIPGLPGNSFPGMKPVFRG